MESAKADAQSTESQIAILQADIQTGESNLSSAHGALSRARDKLREKRNISAGLRVGVSDNPDCRSALED